MGQGAAQNVACGRGVGAYRQRRHVEIVEPRELGHQRRRETSRESDVAGRLAEHLQIGDGDRARRQSRLRRRGGGALGKGRPDQIGEPGEDEPERRQRRDPEAHDIAIGATQPLGRRRHGIAGFEVRHRRGSGLRRRAPAERRHIAAARQVDHHRVGLACPLVILRESPAQPAGLDPDDRIARLVEIGGPPEHIDGDRIALDRRRPAFEGFGHDMAQEIAQPRRLRELGTDQDALKSAPRLVGRHFAAARQPSVPKTAD